VATHLSTLFGIITGRLDQVKDCISGQLVSSSESVNLLLGHINSRGGKMLRPALVLLAGKSCGQITQTHIELAAMVEMVHAATLLHDDVIDGASNRRNTPTVNILCGNEKAVLLGDFLLSKVFAMNARLQSPVITQILSDTTVRVCQGELTQNIQRSNWQLTEEQYLEITRDKTASLFSTCCYLGGFIASGSESQLCALSEYGLNIGTAFQITDDLLDITGDEGKEGKTLGTDLAQRKPTLPIIHLLTNAKEQDKSGLIEKLSSGDELKELAEILENSGSMDFARNMAEQLCKKAAESLEVLAPCPAKDSLAEIVEFISRRSG
jgi:octaprenyl-diphosphate synthase